MSEDSESDGNISPAYYRARVVDQNRPAFEMFQISCGLVEDVIVGVRAHASEADLATELLFVQAYKSYSSVYFLAVRGQEEDAMTIVRRLMEVTAQLAYIQDEGDDARTRERGQAFLEHDPDRQRYFWGRSHKELFVAIGHEDLYNSDYRYLAQISPSAAQRLASCLRQGEIRIRTTEAFSRILSFATHHFLFCCKIWNQRFHLLNEPQLNGLIEKARVAMRAARGLA